jgi:hypothetical protein
LTVFNGRFTTLAPRGDVVGFHLFVRKMLAASDADALLPFVSCAPLAFAESADIQISFIAG